MYTAAQLVYSRGSVNGRASVEEALKQFDKQGLKYLAVTETEGNFVIGFLAKDRLAMLLAHKYGYALYQNKTVTAVMETDFLRVDVQSDIRSMVAAAVNRDAEKVYDDIVVVEENRYAGLVSVRELIVAQMNQIIRQDQALTFQDQSLKETLFRVESAEIRYQRLFDHSLNALAVVDGEGIIVHCNRPFEKLLRSTKALQEYPIHFLQRIHEDDRPAMQALMLDAQRRQGSISDNREQPQVLEIRILTEDQDIRIADCSVYYWPQHNQFIVSLHDITEKKIFEARLRQSEKLSAVGTLLAGITHELNNQLTPILAYVDLVLQQSQGLDTKTIQRLSLVRKSAETASSIVGSLLRYSKPKPLQLKYTDINRLIQDNLQLVQYHSQYKNTAIRLELAETLPLCRIDEHQMGQVLLNLLINALQAMEGKAGQLTIKTSSENSWIVIQISDNGTGIPEHLVQKIFEPFYTTKQPGKGTGLGLSIAHSIVKSHNGNIEVKSQVGVGTDFIVRLPIEPQEVSSPPHEPALRPQTVIPQSLLKKIMVVEDDPAIRQLTVDMIREQFDCQVRMAANGQQALDLLQEDNHYDLILSDIRMPVMDGIEFHRKVSIERPDLLSRFIFITGDTYDKGIVDYITENHLDVLNKPFTIEALFKKISQKNESR